MDCTKRAAWAAWLWALSCTPVARSLPYRPRARAYTVTAVPLLVKEQARLYPFLARDFAPNGVLHGEEVYAFVPGTLTAYAGDTLQLTLVNAEDDVHTFVLADLAVGLAPQSTTQAQWVARAPGIYPFHCNVPAHQRTMWGTVVALAPPE